MKKFKEFLLESTEKQKINLPFLQTQTSKKINEVIEENGGEIFIVGGAVRDAIRGEKDIKDIDFLVRFIPNEELVDILKPIADKSSDGSPKVNEVGKSFGVVTATIDGIDFDFALPRIGETYQKGGKHSEGVEVEVDAEAKIEKDLGRRDFTFNAMAVDIEGNLIDPYGGMEDLKNGQIKAVGDPIKRFDEDPLRILRAIQFANRMGFDIEEKTKEAMETIQDELVSSTDSGDLRVPGDRIIEELKKAWLKSKDGNEKLIQVLDETDIGITLFGSQFDPINVKGKDEVLQVIAFFFNGGDEKLKEWNTPSKYLHAIDLARNFADDEEPWTFVNDANKPFMEQVKEFFQQTDNKKGLERVEKALSDDIPLSPKELAVNGKRLMEFGLKGQEIGLAQKELLSAIWRGKVKNIEEKLLDYIFEEKEKTDER